MDSQRRVIVGTAGHIDHGKTRLVEAITGIDCDRWEEERRRGITIDLGFAHLEHPELQLGFIDVPGHERFLHNALAGLGGIRIMLLVVAADEGVKPQTLEHLEICALLGIPRALVVLSKADLVSSDLLELARLEVEELLADSPWPDAEILETSATEGTGIDEVVNHLVELGRSLPAEDRTSAPARLPIDRAFQLRGLGSIVTGTLVSGTLEAGQRLEVLPQRIQGKVRSIQVHGQERPRAMAGERTAVQLAGIPLAQLERGQQLAETSTLAASNSLLVRFRLLPGAPAPLSGWTDVQAHVLSSEIVGRLRPLDSTELEPGEACVAEVRLAAPLVAVRGDRFVARRPSPPATLGGGVVLDPSWPRPRGSRRARALEALAGDIEQAVGFWVDDTRLHGLDATRLAGLLGTRAEEATSLLRDLEEPLGLLRLEPPQGRPPRWVAARHVESLARRARRLLEDYLARERLAPGMPRAEAVERLLPRVSPEIVRIYLDLLERRGLIAQQSEVLNLPGRRAELSDKESGLARSLRAAYDAAGLQPPPPSEVAGGLGAKRQIVEGVVHYLLQRGELVRLPGDLVISSRALTSARDELLASGLDDFTVAQFKDHFGLSRKWAIPILEHLDAQRVTHRVGDKRRLVRSAST